MELSEKRMFKQDMRVMIEESLIHVHVISLPQMFQAQPHGFLLTFLAISNKRGGDEVRV